MSNQPLPKRLPLKLDSDELEWLVDVLMRTKRKAPSMKTRTVIRDLAAIVESVGEAGVARVEGELVLHEDAGTMVIFLNLRRQAPEATHTPQAPYYANGGSTPVADELPDRW